MEGIFCAQEEDVLKFRVLTDIGLVKAKILVRDGLPAERSWIWNQLRGIERPNQTVELNPLTSGYMHNQPTPRIASRTTLFTRIFQWRGESTDAKWIKQSAKERRTPIRGFCTEISHESKITGVQASQNAEQRLPKKGLNARTER